MYNVPGQYGVAARLIVPPSVRSEPRGAEGDLAARACSSTKGPSSIRPRSSPNCSSDAASLWARAWATGPACRSRCAGPQPARGLELMCGDRHPQLPLRSRSAGCAYPARRDRAGVPSAPHCAAKELAATYFDASERASRFNGGHDRDRRGLTRADVADFHRAHIGPTHATLVLAGDFGDTDVSSLVADAFGAWAPLPRPVEAELRLALRARRTRCALCWWIGPVRCRARSRSPARGQIAMSSPAWAAYPSSALSSAARPTPASTRFCGEEKGYTYGMRASFRATSGGRTLRDRWVGSHGGDGRCIDAPAGHPRRRPGGFSQAECRDGVDFIRNTAPGRYATADAVAEEAAALVLDGLDLDFTTTNLDRMAALTPEDLTQASTAGSSRGVDHHRGRRRHGIRRSVGDPGARPGDGRRELTRAEAVLRKSFGPGSPRSIGATKERRTRGVSVRQGAVPRRADDHWSRRRCRRAVPAVEAGEAAPASVTMGTRAAHVVEREPGSLAISTAPSATSTCTTRNRRMPDRASAPRHQRGHLRQPPGRRPSWAGDGSDIRARGRPETPIRFAAVILRPVQAPVPWSPTSARPSAGAATSPITGSSPSSRAIRVAPDRHAAHEVVRAVDRVDHPTPGPVPGVRELAVDRIARPGA